MRKNEIKGLSAFMLLDGLDDGMILDASLPEAVPASAPTKGEKLAAFFARMGKGGMAAAIAGIVVAVAVLTGVLLAGQMGIGDPVGTGPGQNSHGVQGTLPEQSAEGDTADPSGNSGVIAPPLTESPAQGRGSVAITSDGIMVYPRRFRKAGNCYEITAEGEKLVWSEEGDADRPKDVYDSLPALTTAGGDFSVTAPEGFVMQTVTVYDTSFQKLSEHESIGALSELTDGTYYIVQAAHETQWSSETEYVVYSYEYAFRLTVDSNMDITYPLRLLVGDTTYFLQGYSGIDSGYGLTGMAPSITTATMTRETAWDLYLAPQGTLQSVSAYDGSFRLLMTEPDAEPLVSLPAWEAGDYYFVFTASFPYEGDTLTLEYPIHIVLAEELPEDTTYPNDVGETPDEPMDEIDRILATADPMKPPEGAVLVGQTALYMWYAEDNSNLTKQVSRMAVYRDGTDPYVHHLYADVLSDTGAILYSEIQTVNGYFVLLEYDGTVVISTMEGTISENGKSCNLYGVMEVWLSWTDADKFTGEDTGDVRILRVDGNSWKHEAPIEQLEKLLAKQTERQWGSLSTVLRGYEGVENYGVLIDFWTERDVPRFYSHKNSTCAEALEARDRMLDTDYYQTVWTDFAQRMADRAAGKTPELPPPTPETNPRVVVASKQGSAIFDTEEDGFLAWREVRQSPESSLTTRVDGTPAADVIFAASDNTDPLPALETVEGDPLTLFLDAAGDELILVTVYDAKGGFVAEGEDLSVVSALQCDGWDRGVIVIMQITARISETEIACYEYAFDLTIIQP